MLTKIFLNNQDLRLQALCHKNQDPKAPVVLFTVPTIEGLTSDSVDNSKTVSSISDIFTSIGFSILIMEIENNSSLSTQKSTNLVHHASFAIDWLESYFKEASHFWLCALDQSCIIGSEIVMRRPEIENFILVNPCSNNEDYDFMSPTPCSGIIFNDKNNKPLYENKCIELCNFLNNQNSNIVEFFSYTESRLDSFKSTLSEYINIKLATRIYKPVKKKRRRRRRNDEK